GDCPHIHAEEKRVGVIDFFQLRCEDFVAKYAIARRVIAPEQFREVKEVFLSAMLIIHEGDDLEQSDHWWRSHAVLDAVCEWERQGPGKDVLETNQAHFELAIGPNNTLRLAQSGTGRQQINDRAARPAPTMLSARLLR